METNSLQRNAEYLKGVIATLTTENQSMLLQIDRLEVDIENILSIDARIATLLSDFAEVFDRLWSGGDNFADIASRSDGMLTDKDILRIAEDARTVAMRLRLEINMLEETIKSNNQQIARHQEDIQVIESSKSVDTHI